MLKRYSESPPPKNANFPFVFVVPSSIIFKIIFWFETIREYPISTMYIDPSRKLCCILIPVRWKGQQSFHWKLLHLPTSWRRSRSWASIKGRLKLPPTDSAKRNDGCCSYSIQYAGTAQTRIRKEAIERNCESSPASNQSLSQLDIATRCSHGNRFI